jgi:hypothetical protein
MESSSHRFTRVSYCLAHAPQFLVSFVITPFASNASELVSSLIQVQYPMRVCCGRQTESRDQQCCPRIACDGHITPAIVTVVS